MGLGRNTAGLELSKEGVLLSGSKADASVGAGDIWRLAGDCGAGQSRHHWWMFAAHHRELVVQFMLSPWQRCGNTP